MSTTIDQQVVEMKFDNKHFEDNVQTSLSTLDKLKKSLKLDGAAKGLEEVDKTVKRFDMSGLTGSVGTVTAKFSALEVMGVTALANITNSAVNAGKRIVSALTIDPIRMGFQEYETQMNAVQTILANTESKGSTLQDVNRALGELNTYADKTIYNFTEMTRNIGTFTAAGVDLNTSVSAIKGIANLAAVSGSTSQQASTAMYQLSQALSSGTVKLMDWNSVVNAGMGGQVFQDALKETAKVHGIALDKMIERDGSFRETLQTGWLSAEILTETLNNFTLAAEEGSEEWRIYKQELMDKGYAEEQAEAILKMANTATDAATKVKTFSQLWDTLKESAQSGWTKTWELIIGDFGEAKEFLTSISDKIGGMIGASADARNSLLSGGLSTGWKQLLDKGIADEEGFKDTIKSVVKDINKNDAFDELIKKAEETGGSFDDALSEGLKNGTVSADMLTKSVHKLSDKMAGMSAKELKAAGYTADHVVQIKALSDGLKDGSVSMDEFVGKISRPSGRENLIQALWNAFNGLMKVVAPVKEAFIEIFPPTTGEQLYSLTEAIRNFSERLTISDETADKLKRTFKGVFALLSIGIQIIKAIAGGVADVLGYVMPAGSGILDFTAKIGDFIVGLSEGAKASDVFGNAVGKITDVIKIVLGGLGKFVGAIASAFGASAIFDTSGFDSFIDGLKERLAPLTRIGEAIKSFFMGIFGVVKKVTPVFSALIGVISKVFFGLTDAVADIIGNADFNTLLDLLNGGIFAAMGIGVARFMNGPASIFGAVKDVVKEAGGFVEGIKDILGGVSDALGAFTDSLKAETLKKIATAIAILAAALLVLSLIDSEKLTESLAGITVLFAELMGAMSLFSKVGYTGKGALKSTTIMIGMSVAILVLSAAMKTLSSLDWNGVAKGLVGIAGLAAVVVFAAKMMSSSEKKVIKGATSLVIFALAIKVLASVCRDMSTLSWEELGKGLLGVGALLAAVALFLRVAKFDKQAKKTAKGILILSVALKILASVCSDFGEMSWETIGKGLTGIGALLLEIALFTKLTGNAKRVILTATAMVIIGAAMKIFASVIADMGSMSLETIGKGLLTMAGALAAIVIAMNLLPKNILRKSIGLIGVATALLMLNAVLSSMGSKTWGEIAKGLVTLSGALLIIATTMALMRKALPGALALLVVTSSLLILVPALAILGMMSWEQIAKGLIMLAGTFAIFGVAGLLLKPLIPTLLVLSGVMVAFSLACVGIGVGITLVAVGLTALSAAFVAAGGSLDILIIEIGSILPLILKMIGLFIVSFCEVIAGSAAAICDAVATIIVAVAKALAESVPVLVDSILILLVSILTSLAAYTPTIVSALFDFVIGLIYALAEKLPELIKACVDLLMALFQGVVDALKDIDPQAFLDGVLAIGVLTAIVHALASIAGMIPAAMVGVVGLGAIILELAIVIAAIGELSEMFGGLTDSVEKGGELLEAVGTAIGKLIGGLIGGIAEGATSSLPQIGTNLSEFMNNAEDFIKGVKSMDERVVEGTLVLAGAVLALTSANLIDNITSWLTGGSTIDTFGEKIAEFGKYIKDFSDSVADIDDDSVIAAAEVTGTLAEAAKDIPSDAKKVSEFGSQLKTFGRGIKNFSEQVNGIDPAAVTAAAGAAESLAKMTQSIPNEGGIAAWFAGENSISKFSDDLGALGKGLRNFANETNGIDPAAVTAAAGAAESLAKMTQSIPNEGGVAAWFAGENSISKFSEDIKLLGDGIQGFADKVKDVKPDSISAAASAAKDIAIMCSHIPNEGGVAAWFTGDNSISKFGKDIVSLGEGLNNFSSKVEGIKIDAMSAAVSAARSIVDLTNAIPNSDGVAQWFTGEKSLSKFGGELKTLGTGLKDFGSETSGLNVESVKAAAVAAESLAKMTQSIPSSDGVTQWFTGEKSISKFGGELKSLGTGLKDFGSETSGLDAESVVAAAGAAESLAKMTQSIPSSDGVAQWFSGEKSISKFGGELKSLGTGLREFGNEVAELSTVNIDNGVAAATAIAGLTSVIPSSDGVAQWFTGEKSLSKFGGELKSLGTGLKDFGNEVAELSTLNINNGISAATAIAGLTSVIPSSDGVAQWFSGEKSISKFGGELKSLGTGLKDFAAEAAGIENVEAAKNAITIATSLADLSKVVPEKGWDAIFGADSNLEKFSSDVVSLGEALSAFSNSVLIVKPEAVNRTTTAVGWLNTFADIAKSITDDNDTNLRNFGWTVEGFGRHLSQFYLYFDAVNLDQAISRARVAFDEFNDFISNVPSNQELLKVNVFSSTLSNLIAALKAMQDVDSAGTFDFCNAITEIGKIGLSSLGEGLSDQSTLTQINEYGMNAIQKFMNGIKSKISDGTGGDSESIADCVGSVIDSITTEFDNSYDAFVSAGGDAASGFASGITANMFMVKAAAKDMASAAVEAAKEELDEHSPSRVFYDIGDFAGVAFVNALGSYVDKAADEGRNIAKSTINTLRGAISKISSIINSDIDMQPTIRPVLDLSDVTSGVEAIGQMLSGNRTLAIDGTAVNTVSAMMAGYSANRHSSELLSAINGLRRDVADLPRDTYNINGITYDDGSNIHEAVQTLVRAARIERRK